MPLARINPRSISVIAIEAKRMGGIYAACEVAGEDTEAFPERRMGLQIQILLRRKSTISKFDRGGSKNRLILDEGIFTQSRIQIDRSDHRLQNPISSLIRATC